MKGLIRYLISGIGAVIATAILYTDTTLIDRLLNVFGVGPQFKMTGNNIFDWTSTSELPEKGSVL